MTQWLQNGQNIDFQIGASARLIFSRRVGGARSFQQTLGCVERWRHETVFINRFNDWPWEDEFRWETAAPTRRTSDQTRILKGVHLIKSAAFERLVVGKKFAELVRDASAIEYPATRTSCVDNTHMALIMIRWARSGGHHEMFPGALHRLTVLCFAWNDAKYSHEKNFHTLI